MAREVTNNDDLIDSRDVIARIEELNELVAAGDIDPNDAEELRALEALAEEGETHGDWTYGASLIRDSYFEDYAQEFARDIGAIKDDEDWPANRIDWARAADDLKMDYSPIDFDGVEYWVLTT